MSLRVKSLGLVLAAAALACGSGDDEAPRLPTVEVTREDVVVTVAADGLVEPVRTVEVKSKASGEVIALPVETGDTVAPGALLVQLLPRDAQTAHEQAEAELDDARARLRNAEIQLERAQRLEREGLIPAVDLEEAELSLTSARTQLIRAQKELDLASERLAETRVVSPIAGTVLEKSVEIGSVVSSAVSQVSGGTLLLKLADLSQVQVRSLVDEVDIGRVRAGLPVTIRVEAYPDRTFEGEVYKIEPQAVVEQNVTLFPVLTRIDNPDTLLKPGMNAEVEVLVDERQDVVAVPNEALKPPDDLARIASMLGLDLTREGSGSDDARGRAPEGAGNGGHEERPRRGGRGRGAGEARAVLVASGEGGYRIQPVRTGLSDWERTEIVSGLEPGAEVVLVPSATQLQQSEEFRERIQRMRGMPGMQGGGSRGGRGGGGS